MLKDTRENMKNLFKYTFLVSPLIVVLMSFEAKSQKVTPESLEVWEPAAPLVTPGKGELPPSDAVVLFNGKDLNEWVGKGGEVKWTLKDGAMTVKKGEGDIKTKRSFGSIQLHIEWQTPRELAGEGQGRGNSGIFFQEMYELQVLDSYSSKTYVNGQAGSIYKQSPPLVNATMKPGEWQSYDVVYNAPEFGKDSTLVKPATITVFHNGVLVQNNYQIKGKTEYEAISKYYPHGKAPLVLQEHGNPVSYRNIWVREL